MAQIQVHKLQVVCTRQGTPRVNTGRIHRPLLLCQVLPVREPQCRHQIDQRQICTTRHDQTDHILPKVTTHKIWQHTRKEPEPPPQRKPRELKRFLTGKTMGAGGGRPRESSTRPRKDKNVQQTHSTGTKHWRHWQILFRLDLAKTGRRSLRRTWSV